MTPTHPVTIALASPFAALIAALRIRGGSIHASHPKAAQDRPVATRLERVCIWSRWRPAKGVGQGELLFC
eukprot:2148828-Pleurochrysis_carterae.AAC.1